MLQYYKPSGKWELSSIFYLLVAMVLTIPIAIIYAYAIHYIPIIYANVLCVFGFVLTLSLLVNYVVVKMGKVRNVIVYAVFMVIVTLVAYYIHWVVWIALAFDVPFSLWHKLAVQHADLFDMIKEVSQQGTWTLGHSHTSINGSMLAGVWVVEFLLIFVIPFVMPNKQVFKPFCERSLVWFAEKKFINRSFIENPTEFISKLGQLGASPFLTLGVVSDIKAESHSVITLFSLEGSGENYVTIKNQKATPMKNKKTKFTTTTLISFVSISDQERQILVEGASAPQEEIHHNRNK